MRERDSPKKEKSSYISYVATLSLAQSPSPHIHIGCHAPLRFVQAKKLVLESQKHKRQVREQATQVNTTRRATFVVNAVNSIAYEPVVDDLAASRPLSRRAEPSATQPPFADDVPPSAHLHTDHDLLSSFKTSLACCIFSTLAPRS